ncbi:LLGL2 [Parelaphostrongylus tenuis]|uniref:LLGL2 n=1 Tax=Parelaphostrongylus tenuis TaxID=148309 RepID=A0AAD5QPR0_PARTN|nr:LLGL2 [Parelaphostrongylus tenuis]
MLRFFLQKSSPEQHEDLISDYLEYKRTVRHGFPARVSCFAYDKVLSLLAIGTLDGDINIYGGNGFMWSTEIPGKKGLGKSVAHMYFACGLGVLIVLCRDATFVRFSLEGSQLSARSVLHETRLKKITSCSMMERVNMREAMLLIGTVSGNVFALDITTLELSEYIVFEDALLQRIPENSRREKYSVDLLSVCPTNPRLTIMVFDHRLLIAYDSSRNEVMGSNMFDVQCKNITWSRDGNLFVVALHDGSYASCNPATASVCERPPLVFGPFPCTPAKKVFFAETSSSSERTVLFSGGMPHASYGDRYTVTARQADRTCVFDFSSPVIDFLLTYGADGYHTCALVLTENELVCIDLRDRFWRVIATEQVFPLHASQITTTSHCSHVDEHVWNMLIKIAADADTCLKRNSQWKSGDKTTTLPHWVGDFDPFCDDAGLSIQKVVFDEKSGHVVIGARGGHVLLYSIEEIERVLSPQSLNIELSELSKLSSAGRNIKPLPLRNKPLKYPAGYQPYSPDSQNKSVVVQLQPALAVSAVAVLSSRHLIAASNEYGFALIDINKQAVLLQNSLVNQCDIPHVGALDDALSRFKSMKKSIRQTFRRKKKTPVASLDNTIGTVNSESSAKETSGNNVSKVFSDNEEDEVEVTKPVERLIEERGASPCI